MTLRPIEILDEEIRAPEEQPAPILDWLPIERLRIDDTYQRALGRVNVQQIRKIAEHFRWSRFTPVLVSPIEGGLYAIIDGQHRTHAAALCGFSAVPAMAVHVPRSEQARAFQWVNQQSIRVTPHQVFKAAVTAGDAWARDCIMAVEAGGCRLMTSNASSNDKKPRQVYSVGLVKRMVEKGKAGAVTAALRAISAYDETGRVGLYSDYVLRPWFEAVAEDARFEKIDLLAVLRANDPFRVIEGAARLRQQGGGTVTAKHAFVKLLWKGLP